MLILCTPTTGLLPRRSSHNSLRCAQPSLNPGQLNRSELWVPMSFTQAELVQGAGNWGYRLVGRLKPDTTAAQAQEDAAGAAREIMNNFPPALSSRRIHPRAQFAAGLADQAGPLLEQCSALEAQAIDQRPGIVIGGVGAIAALTASSRRSNSASLTALSRFGALTVSKVLCS